MKSKIFLFLFGLIFMVTGAGTAIFGVYNYASSKDFYKTAETTEGVITDIVTTRTGTGSDKKTSSTAYVTYEAEGQFFDGVQLSYYSSGMYEGKTITIYYEPGNPGHIRVKSGDNMLIFFTLGFGLVFFSVGFGIAFSGALIGRANKRLMKTGKQLNAEVMEVGVKTNVTVNGRHPYYVDCRVQDPYTGEVTLYRSKSIYYDPREYNITNVSVYVSEKNKKKYYVDVEGAVQRAKNLNGIADYR